MTNPKTSGFVEIVNDDGSVEYRIPNYDEVLAETDKTPAAPIPEEELAAAQAVIYRQRRSEQYPSIGDQLDALFKAGAFPEDMAAQIQAVKDAISAMGHGGGYMLSPSNFHPQISIERLKWMIEAGKEHGVYPLKI